MLKGRGVGLGAISREDLPQLLEWRNRPHFRKHFREFRELGLDEQTRWYERAVIDDPGTLMFSIVSLADERLLGCCGFVHIDWVNRTADLSIYVGDNDVYIDDEIAPDAAGVLLGYGFEELDLHRVWTEIYDFDEAKKKLLPSLGFQLEGTHREHHVHAGGRCDSLFWGLLRHEYDAAAAGSSAASLSNTADMEERREGHDGA